MRGEGESDAATVAEAPGDGAVMRRAALSRRALMGLAGAVALLPGLAGRGLAQAAPFAVDWQGGPETPEVARSLAAQIALVRALRIDAGVADFFAAQPIAVDREAGTATRAGPRGVFFERRAVPPDNPVLLHELLHRFHLLRLPDGFGNATVRAFFEQARSSGRYPAGAYMLTNPAEFFAMTASVVLHGRAARPPLLRANVQARSPELFAWIVATFGLRLD